MMPKMITDRTASDVAHLKELYAISWDSMTEDEQLEWYIGTRAQLLRDSLGRFLRDASGRYLCSGSSVQRGSYNYTDLNRIGEAIEYIANTLISLGYEISVVAKHDWTDDSWIILQNQANTYLSDINTLKTIISVEPSTPVSMEKLDWQKANDIEQILVNIYNILQYFGTDIWYCGEAICGGY